MPSRFARRRRAIQESWSWVTWGDPVRFQGDLRRLLEFTAEFLLQHRIEYWIDYGVLLGSIRHGRLILWDYDLDLAVTSSGFEKLRSFGAAADLGRGFTLVYKPDEWYFRVAYREVWADLVEYACDPAARVFRPRLPPYYGDPSNRSEYCPAIPQAVVEPLTSSDVWGRAYPAPADPDAYLRIVYGNYRRPAAVPLLISAAYHPWQTLEFMREQIRRQRAPASAARAGR